MGSAHCIGKSGEKVAEVAFDDMVVIGLIFKNYFNWMLGKKLEGGIKEGWRARRKSTKWFLRTMVEEERMDSGLQSVASG